MADTRHLDFTASIFIFRSCQSSLAAIGNRLLLGLHSRRQTSPHLPIFVLTLFIHEGWMQSIAYLSSKYSSKINLFKISCIDHDDVQKKMMLLLEPCHGASGWLEARAS
jgi:hypothetical protein